MLGQNGIGKSTIFKKLSLKSFKEKVPNRFEIINFRLYYFVKIIKKNIFLTKNFFYRDFRFFFYSLTFRVLLLKKNMIHRDKSLFLDKNILQIFVTFEIISKIFTKYNLKIDDLIIDKKIIPEYVLILRNIENYEIFFDNFVKREINLNRLNTWGDFESLKERYISSFKVIELIKRYLKQNNIDFKIVDNFDYKNSNQIVFFLNKLINE